MDEQLRALEAIWRPEPDPVEAFSASVEMALRDLRAEVAALKAERDELRVRLEVAATAPPMAAVRPVVVVPPEPFTIPWDPPVVAVRRRHPVVRAAAVAASAVIVLLALAVAVGPALLPYRTYHVRSGSMAPGIPTGALVVLTEASASEIGAGDVITFDRPDGESGSVTHRVVEVRPEGFVTKGDANAVADPWVVPAEGTQWRYRFDVPVLGYVFGWLSGPAARIGLVVLSAAALLWVLLSRRQ